METSFTELRTKEVINTTDGKRLGRVCDIVFYYPENRVVGIVVPGGKGFSFSRAELYIEMRNIVKIGEDVILVNCNTPPKRSGKKNAELRAVKDCPPPPKNYDNRRSYEEYE